MAVQIWLSGHNLLNPALEDEPREECFKRKSRKWPLGLWSLLMFLTMLWGNFWYKWIEIGGKEIDMGNISKPFMTFHSENRGVRNER